MSKRISVERAILIGLIWVNGSVLFGFAFPLVLMGVLGEMGAFDRLSGASTLVLALGLLAASFVPAWTAWSLQVPRCRLWAYRRVEDIDALKTAAIRAGLIWREGHVFERTELRSATIRDELRRFEKLAALRTHAEIVRHKRRLTAGGTLGKALVFAMITAPAVVLAPAGLLQVIGFDVAAHPVTWIIVAGYVVALTLSIYWRARTGRVSADEAYRRLLPRWLRNSEPIDP